MTVFSPRVSLVLIVWHAVWVVAAAAGNPPTEEDARAAALRFGQALRRSNAAVLRPILPARGKIRLRIDRLGPEQGSFSPRQVETLLQGFLDRGSIESFDLVSVDHQPGIFALAHARARGTDREGRPIRVKLHLGFQPERDRWTLREIRETPP